MKAQKLIEQMKERCSNNFSLITANEILKFKMCDFAWDTSVWIYKFAYASLTDYLNRFYCYIFCMVFDLVFILFESIFLHVCGDLILVLGISV